TGDSCGGVEVISGSVTMTGGSICDNIGYSGGGVEMGEGTFKISGAPVIKDNYLMGGSECNVYLGEGVTITVNGELKYGAQINIYNTGEIATGFTAANGMGGKDPSDYFISDDSAYNCVYVSNKEDGTVSIGTHDYDNAPWMANYLAHWRACQNGCGTWIDNDFHNSDEEVVSDTYLKSAATCTAKAVYYKSCTTCGAHGTDTFEYGELDEHTHGEAVRENEKAATCTQEGRYDEVVYCSVCQEELSRTPKTTNNIAHPEEVIPAVDATCTVKGSTEGKKCSVCGKVTVAPTEIAMIPHTEAIDNAVAPTCTADGKTEGKHCSVCGYVIVAQTTVQAIGHEYGEWTVTKEATCTEEGS
ncbi:MAG: hypothetical protein K2M36_03470, partial [Clostridia bacterium]|nr:hypothetical protein [Clostridia bacterium]